MTKRGKGYVNTEMGAGRVLSHGKVTDLTEEFKVNDGNTPFALFIIPLEQSTDPVLVSCETFQGDGFADCPFTPNCWDVPALRRIEVDGIDLDVYDVYWGGGADVVDDDES